MLMRACSASAMFQAMAREIFHDFIHKYIVLYLNDHLIFSKDKNFHHKYIKIVLSRLKEHELYVSMEKGGSMKTNIEFLGNHFGMNERKGNPNKTEIIKIWPMLTSVTGIRIFLYGSVFEKIYSKILWDCCIFDRLYNEGIWCAQLKRWMRWGFSEA